MLVNLEPGQRREIHYEPVRQTLSGTGGWRCCLPTAPPKKFILESGRVTGVIAQRPTGQITIHCKACLMATGNLSGDPNIVSRFYPQCKRICSCAVLPTPIRVVPVMPSKWPNRPGCRWIIRALCGGFPWGLWQSPFHPELLAQTAAARCAEGQCRGQALGK